jgi:hypothetical protein
MAHFFFPGWYNQLGVSDELFQRGTKHIFHMEQCATCLDIKIQANDDNAVVEVSHDQKVLGHITVRFAELPEQKFNHEAVAEKALNVLLADVRSMDFITSRRRAAAELFIQDTFICQGYNHSSRKTCTIVKREPFTQNSFRIFTFTEKPSQLDDQKILSSKKSFLALVKSNRPAWLGEALHLYAAQIAYLLEETGQPGAAMIYTYGKRTDAEGKVVAEHFQMSIPAVNGNPETYRFNLYHAAVDLATGKFHESVALAMEDRE